MIIYVVALLIYLIAFFLALKHYLDLRKEHRQQANMDKTATGTNPKRTQQESFTAVPVGDERAGSTRPQNPPVTVPPPETESIPLDNMEPPGATASAPEPGNPSGHGMPGNEEHPGTPAGSSNLPVPATERRQFAV